MSSRNNPGSAPTGGQGKKPSKSQIQKRQAAQRAMAAASGAKAARNKRLVQVGVPVIVVVVVVGILIAVSTTRGHKKANTTSAADRAVTQAVTSVPAAVLDKIGAGTAAGPRKVLTGAPLTANGKPKVLYVGAEWCPYCAAERWSLAVALSRFGTLTDLGQTRSSPTDTAGPNEPTLSFHGSNYTSRYISLTAAEIRDNADKPLDKISASDTKLFTTLGGGYPFVDVGGKYSFGVQWDPTVLGGTGTSQAQVADALSDPSSDIAKAADGAANILTAAICQVTNQQPTSVCSSKGVVAAKSKLDVSS